VAALVHVHLRLRETPTRRSLAAPMCRRDIFNPHKRPRAPRPCMCYKGHDRNVKVNGFATQTYIQDCECEEVTNGSSNRC
jgi:hypothetical protein